MNKVIFLDRDGVINKLKGEDYIFRVEDWEFEENAIEGLKLLQKAGFTLAIVTVQSGIGHGIYTEADMHKLHSHMNGLLEAEGITIAAIVFCPHKRGSACDCRKPNIGMAEQVEKEVGEIDYDSSWMIGDKENDLLFGKNINAQTALIHSKYWQEEKLSAKPDIIVDSLYEAAQHITKTNA